MHIEYSEKHAMGAQGEGLKASSHPNGIIIRSKCGSPVLIRGDKNAMWIKSTTGGAKISPLLYFGDTYFPVPKGVVVSLTQE